MKIHFKAAIAGLKIDKVIEGETAEEVVKNLRNHVAGQIPHVPFTKKDDEYREKLDVDGKGDWTDQEFYRELISYYNANMLPKGKPPVNVPSTAEEFVRLAVAVGMALRLDSVRLPSPQAGQAREV